MLIRRRVVQPLSRPFRTIGQSKRCTIFGPPFSWVQRHTVVRCCCVRRRATPLIQEQVSRRSRFGKRDSGDDAAPAPARKARRCKISYLPSTSRPCRSHVVSFTAVPTRPDASRRDRELAGEAEAHAKQHHCSDGRMEKVLWLHNVHFGVHVYALECARANVPNEPKQAISSAAQEDVEWCVCVCARVHCVLVCARANVNPNFVVPERANAIDL